MNNNNKAGESESISSSRMRRKQDYRRSEARGWFISLAVAFTIALLLRLFVFEFISVSGPSMEPTLFSDEYVFMEKVSYWFQGPEYGDVVICKFPHSTDTYVKRVIGTPGDILEIADGVLYINGQPDTTFFSGHMNGSMAPITVPEGCVFVMGDNRNESMDSRYDSIGPLPYKMVLGRAQFVIWPLDEIKGL